MDTKQWTDEQLAELVKELTPRLTDAVASQVLDRLARQKAAQTNLFVPSPDLYQNQISDGFMSHSTCSSRDFLHPEFKRLWEVLNFKPFFYHRKYWEWVFILHHLLQYGVAGKRGIGFGVGATEPLTAAFVKFGANVTATDAPADVALPAGWKASRSYADRVEDLPHEGIVDRQTFRNAVTFQECDMNAIPDDLREFDFCWSSCCFEHLGSLRKGLDFVVNSVEKTLRVGGVACHTTEFNLSSNDDTVAEGPTVLYREKDLQELIAELRSRGHMVDNLRIAPDAFAMDGYVDTPPYGPPVHMKLKLLGFTATSVGLVIRRGR